MQYFLYIQAFKIKTWLEKLQYTVHKFHEEATIMSESR